MPLHSSRSSSKGIGAASGRQVGSRERQGGGLGGGGGAVLQEGGAEGL